MADKRGRPERDTSPTGEISARQTEDGTYEIVAEDSSASNDVSKAKMSESETTDKPRPTDDTDDGGPALKSPLTIGLLVLTLLVAGATVAYFVAGATGDSDEPAAAEGDPGFKPYEGDDQAAAQPVEEPDPREHQQAAAEPDAAGLDDDAGPRERKTEIIVLEEGVDEAPEDDDTTDRVTVDKEQLEQIDIGPGAAARLKNGAQLNVDPGKLRNIRFQNSKVPEVLKNKIRERRLEEGESADQGTPEDVPPGEIDDMNEGEQPTELDETDEPVIE